jgi:pimeloyl-ACP methyl ester carboxylesterase
MRPSIVALLIASALLTAGKGLGIRAFVAFAPAAQIWNPVLAERLRRGVRQAEAPILIIQAQNDYSVDPAMCWVSS